MHVKLPIFQKMQDYAVDISRKTILSIHQEVQGEQCWKEMRFPHFILPSELISVLINTSIVVLNLK